MTDNPRWFLSYNALRYGVGARVAVLNLLLLALFAGLISWYSQHIIWEVVRAEHAKPVIRIQNGLLSIYQTNGKAGLAKYIVERIAPGRPADTALLLAEPDGKIIAGNLSRWPSRLEGRDSLSFGWVKLRDISKPVYMGFTTSYLADGSRLLIGVSVLPESRLIELQMRVFLVSLALAVVIALIIWVLTAAIMMARFKDAWRIMEMGAQGEFSERIPLSGSGDRFDQFFATVNRSLNRVEPMMQEMRIVTTGVAHDVRSPLSRLRLTVERAKSETADRQTAEQLERAFSDIDLLLSMLSKTMEIAQAQSSSRQPLSRCDLVELIARLLEVYQPVAEEHGLTVTFEAMDELVVPVHRHLLEKALANIIENALNYAEGASFLNVSVRIENDDAVIAIADDGVGIPEHRFEDAVRRYGRLDPARHVAGTGLGLTIADAVAKMHGGSLCLSSNNPGLRVTLRLPRNSIS